VLDVSFGLEMTYEHRKSKRIGLAILILALLTIAIITFWKFIPIGTTSAIAFQGQMSFGEFIDPLENPVIWILHAIIIGIVVLLIHQHAVRKSDTHWTYV
jgi:threonine/homoserine efflux transporter RhtA